MAQHVGLRYGSMPSSYTSTVVHDSLPVYAGVAYDSLNHRFEAVNSSNTPAQSLNYMADSVPLMESPVVDYKVT